VNQPWSAGDPGRPGDSSRESPPPARPTPCRAKSAYDANQPWTCSGGNIYKCVSGVPQEQVCENGCQTNPIRTDDVRL
jgi:hypothetical protein